MDEQQKPVFDGWAIVEQMGHNRFAGRISEQVLGGASLIRIEVPDIPERKRMRPVYNYQTNETTEREEIVPATPGFTKFIGVSSVFAITPCTEEVARLAAEQMRSEPINCITLQQPAALLASAPEDEAGDDNPDADPEGQY